MVGSKINTSSNKADAVEQTNTALDFLSNYTDQDTKRLLDGAATYDAFKSTTSTLDPLIKANAGVDYFGINRPKQETVSWGGKLWAAMNLENVTGRIGLGLAGSSMFSSFNGQDDVASTPIPLTKIDGTTTTDYTANDWWRVNGPMLEKLSGGDEIARNFSLGSYDNMRPAQFIAAMGLDAYKGELRKDLNTSTGSVLGDMTSVMAGSLADPVSLMAGNALAAGLKSSGSLLVAAARGEVALQAAQKAGVVATLTGTTLAKNAGAIGSTVLEGVAQNTARSAMLTIADPNDHNMQEYVDNLAFGLAIDGTRAIGVGALKALLNKYGPSVHKSIGDHIRTLEGNTKSRIDAASESAFPDPVIQTIHDIETLKSISNKPTEISDAVNSLENGIVIDSNARINGKLYDINDELNGSNLDSANLKDPNTRLESKLSNVNDELNNPVVKIDSAKTDVPLADVIPTTKAPASNITSVDDYLPDRSNDGLMKIWNKIRNTFGYGDAKVTDASITGKLSTWFGTAMKFELSDNPLDRAIFDLYSAGTAGVAMVGETGGKIEPMFSYELVKQFFRNKQNDLITNGLETPFKKYFAVTSTGQTVSNLSGIGLDATNSSIWSTYNEFVERLRIAGNKYAGDNSKLLLPGEPVVKGPTVISAAESAASRLQIFNDYKTKLFAGLSDDAALSKFNELTTDLKNNGILDGTPAWMNVNQSSILKNTTSIELRNTKLIDGQAVPLTLTDLNKIMSKVFDLEQDASGMVLPANKIDGLLELVGLNNKSNRASAIISIEELKNSFGNPKLETDLVQRLVEHFNNKLGGLVDGKIATTLLNEFGSTIGLSSENTVMNHARLLQKIQLAQSMKQRLEEFKILENKHYGSEDISVGSIDPLLKDYRELNTRLTNLNEALLASQPADLYRKIDSFNYDALDAMLKYNKDVQAPRLAGENLDAWNKRTTELGQYLKHRMGMLSVGESNAVVESFIAFSHALMLQGSGIAMLGEVSKAVANGLTVPSTDFLSNLGKAFVFDLKKAKVSQADAILMLESMVTMEEDLKHLIGRMTAEADGAGGFKLGDARTKAETTNLVINQWRKAIGVMSGQDLGVKFSKRLGFFNEYNAHVQGENNLFNLGSQIVDRIANGESPVEATKAVAVDAKLSGTAKDNLFYNFNAMSNYWGHDEIKAMSALIKEINSGKVFNNDGTFSINKNLAEVTTTPITTSKLGSIFADGKFDVVDTVGNGPITRLGQAVDDPMSANALISKFGRYMDFAIEQKNMNVPTALADFARMDTGSLPYRLMTQFLRSPTAQVINTTYGASNRGMATRASLALYFGGVGAGIYALKAYMNGTTDKMVEDMQTWNGRASLANNFLDYSGLTLPLVGRGINVGINSYMGNGFDSMNAMNNFVPAPFSAVKGVIDGSKGIRNLVLGNELSASEKKWTRKLLTGNMLDTTVFRLPTQTVQKLIGDEPSQIKSTLDFFYAKPASNK